MTRADAILTLLHISEEDLKHTELYQLRDILGSLRCVTRQIEHEIFQREIEASKHEELLLQ